MDRTPSIFSGAWEPPPRPCEAAARSPPSTSFYVPLSYPPEEHPQTDVYEKPRKKSRKTKKRQQKQRVLQQKPVCVENCPATTTNHNDIIVEEIDEASNVEHNAATFINDNIITEEEGDVENNPTTIVYYNNIDTDKVTAVENSTATTVINGNIAIDEESNVHNIATTITNLKNIAEVTDDIFAMEPTDEETTVSYVCKCHACGRYCELKEYQSEHLNKCAPAAKFVKINCVCGITFKAEKHIFIHNSPCSHLHNKHTDVDDDVDELMETLIKLRVSNTEEQSQPLARRSVNASVIERQENVDLPAEYADLTKENGNLTTENGDLSAANGDLFRKHVDMIDENADLNTNNVDMSKKNVHLTTEYVDLTKDDVELTVENRDLTTEYVDLTTNNRDLAMENVDFTTEYVDTTKDYVDLTTDSIDLTTDTVDRTIEIGDLSVDNLNLPTENSISFGSESKVIFEEEKTMTLTIDLQTKRTVTSTSTSEGDDNISINVDKSKEKEMIENQEALGNETTEATDVVVEVVEINDESGSDVDEHTYSVSHGGSEDEDEEVVFKEMCAMFRFDFLGRRWRPRGMGYILILDFPERNTCALRFDRQVAPGEFRTALMMSMHPGLTLLPMKYNDRGWEWTYHYVTADGTGEFQNLALRFRTKDLANKFHGKFYEKKKLLLKNVISRDVRRSLLATRCPVCPSPRQAATPSDASTYGDNSPTFNSSSPTPVADSTPPSLTAYLDAGAATTQIATDDDVQPGTSSAVNYDMPTTPGISENLTNFNVNEGIEYNNEELNRDISRLHIAQELKEISIVLSEVFIVIKRLDSRATEQATSERKDKRAIVENNDIDSDMKNGKKAEETAEEPKREINKKCQEKREIVLTRIAVIDDNKSHEKNQTVIITTNEDDNEKKVGTREDIANEYLDAFNMAKEAINQTTEPINEEPSEHTDEVCNQMCAIENKTNHGEETQKNAITKTKNEMDDEKAVEITTSTEDDTGKENTKTENHEESNSAEEQGTDTIETSNGDTPKQTTDSKTQLNDYDTTATNNEENYLDLMSNEDMPTEEETRQHSENDGKETKINNTEIAIAAINGLEAQNTIENSTISIEDGINENQEASNNKAEDGNDRIKTNNDKTSESSHNSATQMHFSHHVIEENDPDLLKPEERRTVEENMSTEEGNLQNSEDDATGAKNTNETVIKGKRKAPKKDTKRSIMQPRRIAVKCMRACCWFVLYMFGLTILNIVTMFLIYYFESFDSSV